MEPKKRREFVDIVVGYGQRSQIGQEMHKSNWELTYFILANVQNFKILKVRATKFSYLGESIRMHMKLSERWQELQNVWNRFNLVTVQPQVTQLFHTYLTFCQIVFIVKASQVVFIHFKRIQIPQIQQTQRKPLQAAVDEPELLQIRDVSELFWYFVYVWVS